MLKQYLEYRFKFNHYPRNNINSNFPTVLCIEPTSVCNLRCTMCFQSDENFSGNKEYQGNMSLEMFKNLIDEGKEYGLSSIVLASRGEPMLNKDIFEMIRYAKDNGIIDVKMNTNATLMNERKARKLLESGLDNLVFSVDSPHKEEFEKIRRGANFDKIIRNIKNFNKIRSEEFPNSNLRTRISMVVIDDNQDVEYAEEFWGNLVDEFAFRNVIDRLYIYDKDNIEYNRPCSFYGEDYMYGLRGRVAYVVKII
ncbi:radical SAM protein [Staphylococcus saprophyticus]